VPREAGLARSLDDGAPARRVATACSKGRRMKKNLTPTPLTLTRETLRALAAPRLLEVAGGMKPRRTFVLGCQDHTSNCTWDC
jgi:hypothetical protein